LYVPITDEGLVIEGVQNPNSPAGPTSGLISAGGSSGKVLTILAPAVTLNNLLVDGNGLGTDCVVLANAQQLTSTNLTASGCTRDEIQINPVATPATTLSSAISSGTTSFTVANAALQGITLGGVGCGNLMLDYGTASQEEKSSISGSGNTMTTTSSWAYTHSIGATVQCAGNDDNMTLQNTTASYSTTGWGFNIYNGNDVNDIRSISLQAYNNYLGGVLVAGSSNSFSGNPHFENNGGPPMQIGDLDGGAADNVVSPNGGNGRDAVNTTIDYFGDNEGNTPNSILDVCSSGNSIHISRYTGYAPGGAGTCPNHPLGVNSIAEGPYVNGSGDALWRFVSGFGAVMIDPSGTIAFYNSSGVPQDQFGWNDTTDPSWVAAPWYTKNSVTQYQMPNYVTETDASANNALVVTFQDPNGNNIPLGAPPVQLNIHLAHSLQAGTNTITVNGTTYGILGNVSQPETYIWRAVPSGAFITLTWNNSTGAFILNDGVSLPVAATTNLLAGDGNGNAVSSGIAATDFLLATGATTGATSQAQVFTDGVNIGTLTAGTGALLSVFDNGASNVTFQTGADDTRYFGIEYDRTNEWVNLQARHTSFGSTYADLHINLAGGAVELGYPSSAANSGGTQEAICLADGTGCPTTLPIYTSAATAGSLGTGVTSVTCATASCTNLRGSYTVVGGTFTGGNIFSLSWTATPTAYVCSVVQNVTSAEGGTFYALGHTVATTTGMTVTSQITLAGQTFNVDYSCQP
jgi:hypothetical protein